MTPNDLVPGKEIALEFAQSETIRRAASPVQYALIGPDKYL